MIIIGLTGGIGSGKSTVSEYLKSKNYFISDADKIAHDILEPGMPALAKLVLAFGNEILDEHGRLKRKKLAEIAFADKNKEQTLNQITHGQIKEQILKEIEICKEAGEKIMFLDIPLLFEQGLDKWCDVSWAIVVDQEIRIKRVLARDDIKESDVRARIDCQMADDQKKKLADEVLDNSFSKEELYRQIDELLVKYEQRKEN